MQYEKKPDSDKQITQKSKNNKINNTTKTTIYTNICIYVCIWGTIIKSKAHHDLEANAKKIEKNSI